MQNILNIDWEIGIKSIADSSVDLVLTDPPYGINYRSSKRNNRHKAMPNDDNLEWLDDWVKELKRVCKPEAHLYIFCSWHNVEVFKFFISKEFRIKNILIWEKENHGCGDLKGDYAPKYEMILFCSNGSKKLNGRRDCNILKSAKTKNNNHPTEKPVNLISYLIEKSTDPGDLVLDTFGGSCSTAIASKQTNRNCIVFEIEADYCINGRKNLAGTSKRLFGIHNYL